MNRDALSAGEKACGTAGSAGAGPVRERDGSVALAIAVGFAASLCLMAIEVAAGRIMSRHYGASLYTWTSVIGVVLGGLSVGNYAGGRLADRRSARRLLATLLLLASTAGVGVVVLSERLVEGEWLATLRWRTQILAHTLVMFGPPAVFLGMVGPVAARMALASDSRTGRMLGLVYAWSTVGSILGTFLAGFYLVSAAGPNGVILIVSGALAVGGSLLLCCRGWGVAWSGVLLFLVLAGSGPWGWARSAGGMLGLRQGPRDYVLFEKESNYSRVRVLILADGPEIRYLYLDKLIHSQAIFDDPDHLLYDYERIYAVLTHRFGQGKDRLRTLTLGGGGYVFPSYLARHWPGSHTEVVEIDPVVTEAAERAFGLKNAASLEIHHLDARNHVESLVQRKHRGQGVGEYDFIYSDAFNDLSPPHHLTTVEFVRKLAALLSAEGLYAANIIDNFDPGSFLSAVVDTVDAVFPHTYVLSPKRDIGEIGPHRRVTWVVVGSRRALDLRDLRLRSDEGKPEVVCWNVGEEDLQDLRARCGRLVLSDDYAPVDQLVEHLQRTQISERFVHHYNEAVHLTRDGDLPGAIREYREVLGSDPDNLAALHHLGLLLIETGELAEAISLHERALSLEPAGYELRCNYGLALAALGRAEEAIAQYREAIRLKPNDPLAYVNLGMAWAGKNRYGEAVDVWREGLRHRPTHVRFLDEVARILASCPDAGMRNGGEAVALVEKAAKLTGEKDAGVLDTLGIALAEAGRFEEAVSTAQRALELASQAGNLKLAAAISSRLKLYRSGRAYRKRPGVVDPR